MSTNNKNSLPWILGGIILIVAIFLLYGSYLFGKNKAEEKYRQESLQIDARIDSLRGNEIRLRDSLSQLQNEQQHLISVRTVYKTVYDTVYLKTVPTKIVDGLNFIISTPIPPRE